MAKGSLNLGMPFRFNGVSGPLPKPPMQTTTEVWQWANRYRRMYRKLEKESKAKERDGQAIKS